MGMATGCGRRCTLCTWGAAAPLRPQPLSGAVLVGLARGALGRWALVGLMGLGAMAVSDSMAGIGAGRSTRAPDGGDNVRGETDATERGLAWGCRGAKFGPAVAGRGA